MCLNLKERHGVIRGRHVFCNMENFVHCYRNWKLSLFSCVYSFSLLPFPLLPSPWLPLTRGRLTVQSRLPSIWDSPLRIQCWQYGYTVPCPNKCYFPNKQKPRARNKIIKSRQPMHAMQGRKSGQTMHCAGYKPGKSYILPPGDQLRSWGEQHLWYCRTTARGPEWSSNLEQQLTEKLVYCKHWNTFGQSGPVGSVRPRGPRWSTGSRRHKHRASEWGDWQGLQRCDIYYCHSYAYRFA